MMISIVKVWSFVLSLAGYKRIIVAGGPAGLRFRSSFRRTIRSAMENPYGAVLSNYTVNEWAFEVVIPNVSEPHPAAHDIVLASLCLLLGASCRRRSYHIC